MSFRQGRCAASDAETIIRGVDERPPTRWNTQTMLSARTTTAKRCRNHIQGHTRTPTNPSEPPNHNFDKNDDCQAMPKSYSGDNPEFSKPVQTFVSPGRGAEVLSALNPPTQPERYTSWLLARKEERGQPLPQPATPALSAPRLRNEQSPQKHPPLSGQSLEKACGHHPG